MTQSNHYCDGIARRDLVRAGMLSAAFTQMGFIGQTGLAIDDYGRLDAIGGVSGAAPAKHAIFVELPGGPSHIDSFDPKPDAPAEIRGSFQTIATQTPGMRLSEHLPKLAAISNKFALLRGVSHTLAAHQLGQEYVVTGSKPIASLEYPSYGSVVGRTFPSQPDLPSHVAVPRSVHGPGFLGIAHSPLETNTSPKAGERFNVRGISAFAGVQAKEIGRRQQLLGKLDRRFAESESDPLIAGLDEFGSKAYQIITSKRARDAFDISKEPDSFAEPFGDDSFGQSCLLAIRLVESGVRFTTVQFGGWDTHNDNFTALEKKLPILDTGLSALLVGLEQRGLLDSTAVYVTGEFGRTPKINEKSEEGGRDHYPRCMTMLMAGGGIRGGQVIGESDATASGPKNDAIKPDDVAASFYANLGIDPKTEFHTSSGRPITLVRDGEVIRELFG